MVILFLYLLTAILFYVIGVINPWDVEEFQKEFNISNKIIAEILFGLSWPYVIFKMFK